VGRKIVRGRGKEMGRREKTPKGGGGRERAVDIGGGRRVYSRVG